MQIFFFMTCTLWVFFNASAELGWNICSQTWMGVLLAGYISDRSQLETYFSCILLVSGTIFTWAFCRSMDINPGAPGVHWDGLFFASLWEGSRTKGWVEEGASSVNSMLAMCKDLIPCFWRSAGFLGRICRILTLEMEPSSSSEVSWNGMTTSGRAHPTCYLLVI